MKDAVAHTLGAQHPTATDNALHWDTLAQAPRATRDARLLEPTSAWHPRKPRRLRCTDALIEQLPPQMLTSL